MIPATFTCPICKETVELKTSYEVSKEVFKHCKGYTLTSICQICHHKIAFGISERLYKELFDECEKNWASKKETPAETPAETPYYKPTETEEKQKYSIGDIASSILMICFGIFIVIMSILLYIVVNNDIKNPKPKQVIELQAQFTEAK